MPTNRRKREKRRRTAQRPLDSAELWFCASGVGNRADVLEVYRAHEAEILDGCAPGCRPKPWWWTRGLTMPEHPADRLKLLASMGELAPDEIERLKADSWGRFYLKKANILTEGES